MENLKDDCGASKPQSEPNVLSEKNEIEATTFETMETNVEEAIVVPNKSNEEMTKEGNTVDENVKEEVKTDERMTEEVGGGGEVEENSTKKKVNKKKKRSKKVTLGDKNATTTKEAEKSGSSKKKATGSSKKKADSSGMIFMCSSRTKKDCYRYKVLGLPASRRDDVQKIYKGMRLFLFDFDLRLMYGIYRAAGPGGYNIEPKAFGSAFPAQVRFSVLEDCLPLAEEKFKKVIKDNYYKKNKFDCALNSDQVKNLCKLFQAAGKGSKSKSSGRSHKRAAQAVSDRRRRTRVGREERDHRLYNEPHDPYEREVYVSPRTSRPLQAPLPLLPAVPIPPPSYAYRRPSEMEVYRREPLPGGYDQQYLDLEVRYRDDIEYRDPYVRSREHPLSHDLKYSSGRPSGHHPPVGLRPEYYPPAGPSIEHRPPAGLRPEYYPPAGPSIEHHPPAGLRPEYYPPAGPSSEHRPLPEYYTLADRSSEYLSAVRQPEYVRSLLYR